MTGDEWNKNKNSAMNERRGRRQKKVQCQSFIWIHEVSLLMFWYANSSEWEWVEQSGIRNSLWIELNFFYFCCCLYEMSWGKD